MQNKPKLLIAVSAAAALAAAVSLGIGHAQVSSTGSGSGSASASASASGSAGGCGAAPVVSLSVSPSTIWPPNNKMVNVVLTASVQQPAGCTVMGAVWSLADSQGSNQSGSLSAASNGTYTATVSVSASRIGSNKAGRVYGFTASISNNSGSGSGAASAVVPHDMGR